MAGEAMTEKSQTEELREALAQFRCAVGRLNMPR